MVDVGRNDMVDVGRNDTLRGSKRQPGLFSISRSLSLSLCLWSL
jgi:hypothetical protein